MSCSGASTGTGGRIRDVQAVGRGGFCVAATAAYCVGNLFIPGKLLYFSLIYYINTWFINCMP